MKTEKMKVLLYLKKSGKDKQGKATNTREKQFQLPTSAFSYLLQILVMI